MSDIVFRFDIDSPLCMKKGVPILLDISHRYNIRFTFFLNAGRSISLRDTLESFSGDIGEAYDMLTSYQKLGFINYIYTALINPKMTKYKKQVKALLNSDCEVGLHGGMNHSKWYTHALNWDRERIDKEISCAIVEINKICPDFYPKGFASPGFVSPVCLEEVLFHHKFEYYSDKHIRGENEVVENDNILPLVRVNLCGEPGGIAFWENAMAKGLSDSEIEEEFMAFVEEHDKVVVFDHPYVVALRKRECLEHIIEQLITKGHKIVTMYELIKMENN